MRADGARIRTLTAVGQDEESSDDTGSSCEQKYFFFVAEFLVEHSWQYYSGLGSAGAAAGAFFQRPQSRRHPLRPVLLSPLSSPHLASSNPGWGQTGMPFLATAKLSPYDLGRVPAFPAPGMVDAPLPIFCGSRTS